MAFVLLPAEAGVRRMGWEVSIVEVKLLSPRQMSDSPVLESLHMPHVLSVL